MAYCTANDDVKVLTRFYSAYSSSTVPSLTDVSGLITGIDGEINAYLGALGLTTISNASNLALLKRYSAIGTAGMVMSAWSQNPNDREQAIIYINEYRLFCERLINNPGYGKIFIENENSASMGDLTGSAITKGILPTIESTTINNGEGSYITETFTY